MPVMETSNGGAGERQSLSYPKMLHQHSIFLE